MTTEAKLKCNVTLKKTLRYGSEMCILNETTNIWNQHRCIFFAHCWDLQNLTTKGMQI